MCGSSKMVLGDTVVCADKFSVCGERGELEDVLEYVQCPAVMIRLCSVCPGNIFLPQGEFPG